MHRAKVLDNFFGPKLMSCKLVQVGTEKHGKMLKRIQILEGGRVLPNEAENWKIEREKEEDY